MLVSHTLIKLGTLEMLQWSHVLAVPTEDPSLVPSTTLPLTATVEYYMPSLGFCGSHNHKIKITNQSIYQSTKGGMKNLVLKNVC